ncbi:MAG: hypothetical protein AAGF23_22995, partial [Acidobacteriota bacterium]
MPHRFRPPFESSRDSLHASAVAPAADIHLAGLTPGGTGRPSVDAEPPPWTLPWATLDSPARCPSTADRTGFRPDRSEPHRRLVSPVRADPELLRRCLSPRRTEEDWRRFKARFECAIRNIAARSLCQLGFGTCRDAVDELVQEVYLRWLRSDRRPDFEPRDVRELPLFLALHQGLTEPGDGLEALQERLERLFGLALPAGLWEGEILPARLRPYYPSWLDSAMQQSELMWLGVGKEKVTFGFDSDRELFVEPSAPSAVEDAP